MPIQLLPPQLANQIAAGEVVERPASVVKELIENSLDAGATRIELDIEKGGHKRIRLRDNGGGICKDELPLALSRHATSKIATLDDLEQIMSLGFRGEALASISSVSRLTLTSRPEDQEQAWQAHCEGRDMEVTVNPVAHPNGTTIDVADLFYNTPARRKFLRTEKTEYQHIEDVVRRIALSHPDVSFLLKHNGKMTKRYQASSADPLTRRISAVMGQKFLSNAVYVKTGYDGMTLEAWLGNETMLRSSTDSQFSFVNGRGMRDKLILHAIRQAYESVWGVLEQPSFVVYLTVDPRDVDVNVHPAKHEVRFQQSRLVHDFICKAVADALSDGDTGETAQFDEPEHDYIRPLAPAQPQDTHQGLSPENNGYSTTATQSVPRSAQTFAGSSAGTAQGRYHGSGAAGGTGRHRSAPVPAATVADYGQRYSTLLSSQIDTQETSALSFLQLNEYVRIYCHKNNCLLLSVNAIIAQWVAAQIEQAGTSQPLLMPVSVANTNVSEQTVEVLQDHHFEISLVAGKYRLQQAPSGCRHFPWVNWFPVMLTSGGQNLNDVLKSLISVTTVPADILTAVWHGFELMPVSEQITVLEQQGRSQPADRLIETWPE